MIYMGDISQGVQILNLMSYFWNTLRPFLGDLELCYIYAKGQMFRMEMLEGVSLASIALLASQIL